MRLPRWSMILAMAWVGIAVYLLVAIYGAERMFDELMLNPETPVPELIEATYESIKLYLMLLAYLLIGIKERMI